MWGRLLTCGGLAIRLPDFADKAQTLAGPLRIAQAD
jgi:hypothetical protein